MKRNLQFLIYCLFFVVDLHAQVTQINSNRSLQFDFPLSSTKAIYVSKTDQTIWATDGTLAGTIQLSADIKMVGDLGSLIYLDGKLIFSGTTAATGAELYITDGTPGGTLLVKDINAGAAGSSPDFDVAIMNGFMYFTAATASEGRELWRTDGTPVGTTLVKDIFPGTNDSNLPGNYQLFSSGTYLLFAARTASQGIELWRSDGTGAGTVLLKDINTNNAGADSSNPKSFYPLNGIVIFTATDATHGEEIWTTDGTAGGTNLLLDINPGTGSSTSIELFPGFSIPIIGAFHIFKNHVYFVAYDGVSAGEVWSTDGTTANTFLLKDIVTGGALSSFILLVDAVDLPDKFIFPVATASGRSELWQSDGTPGGTILFKAFTPAAEAIPFIFVPYNLVNGGPVGQSLFQGNKFFFAASNSAEGNEVWISDGVDGTAAHTSLLKDINVGAPDGIDTASFSYCYTSAGIYFPAVTTGNGVELWKSDGTLAGTTLVADIITGPTGSKPDLSIFIVNGKVLFEANNGDNAIETDLYAVDGIFTPLPVTLADFTVVAKQADALLNWHTLQELNNKGYTIQRSFNGLDYENIGQVSGAGSSSALHSYWFTDAGILNSGKTIVYYRLLIADVDGKSAFSPVIALRIEGISQLNVKLMSNPVTDYLKLMVSGAAGKLQLSIIDMRGNRLYSKTVDGLNGQVSLPVNGLPQGMYFLQAETGSEKRILRFKK